ncbi:MAG: AAA family ATPase [Planctomycetota bacterium]|nr:AAA family ATPase [Planctomycetota bacterium]
MRLVAVTVRNYRIHREVTVPFGEGLTVVAGPNESGKSTLVEAVHHALFLRSRVTGEIAQSLRSAHHAGHPSVVLEFEAAGRRLTIEKSFAGAKGTTTLKEQGGKTRHNEEAEEEIHRILQEDDAGGGKGAAKQVRGRWAHLWVWQGTSGADPGEAKAGDRSMQRLRERLGRMGGGSVLESAGDRRVAASLEDLVAATFTDKGKPRTGSDLLKAGDDLATVLAARTAADAALAALDQAVRDVDAADRAIAEGTKSLLRIRAEIDSVQKRREELAKVEGTLTEARIAAEAARRAHDELDRADAEIRDLDIRIRGAEETLRPAREDLGCAKAAEVTQRSRFDAALVALRELTARHREAGASAERHALVEQVERQRVERTGLASRCDLIVAHRRRAGEIRVEIRRLPPVKGEDVEKLVALERAADAAAAELRAIATRVEVIAADAPVRLGETSLVVGGAETITAEAEIVVGGTTRLRVVPGGGRSLAECTRKSEVAATALAERLSTLGVASTDQARRDAARLAGLANDLRAEESTVKGLGDEQALRELATLDGAIAELDARLARQGAEGFTWAEGLESALVARRAADDEVHRLATALGGATTEFDVAKTLADGAVAEHARIAESIRSAQDSLAGLRTRRQAIVEKVGEERAGELASRAAALKEADDCLAVFQRQRAALEPETIERDQKRYQKSLDERQDEMRQAEMRRQLALAMFHASGTSDPSEDRARAMAREAQAVATHARLERDGQAARLLLDLFREGKQAVEDRFIEPLKARVGDYLQSLFGPGAAVSIDFEGGEISAVSLVRPADGAVPFGFDTLSGGTREQVGAALRLAMAEILAEDHDGCLPVVFDDAFVNADPERLRGLQRVLDLGAQRGLQVVVLTCDAATYDTLGVGITRIQRPGGE